MILIGLIAAAMAAIVNVWSKKISLSNDALSMMAYFIIGTSIFSGLWMAINGTWQTPSMQGVIYIALAGLSANLAHYLVIQAHKRLPSAVYGSLIYLGIPTTAISGWVFLQETLGAQTIIGISMIIASNLAMVWYGSKTKHQRRKYVKRLSEADLA